MTAANYDLSNEQDREDRRKHLDLVSAAIARLAGASFAAKGWSLTIAGAAFGVAAIRENWYLVALGFIVLLAFAVIDGLYLHNEQKFRDLYDAITRNEIAPFAMDLSDTVTTRSKNKSYRSWSIIWFYCPLLLAGILLTLLALATSGGEDHQPRHVHHRGYTPSDGGRDLP
jgi:hypothetical protein